MAYSERVVDMHNVARLQAFFIAAPNLKKGITFKQFCKDYKLPNDEFDKPDEELINKARRLYEQRRS